MDLICMLGFLKQGTCLEVLLYDTRPFLALFNSIASGQFCDRGISLHIYGQQYGFFYGKRGSYPCQCIDPYVVCPGDFFDSLLVQLLQGVLHFFQVLGHAFVFGSIFFLHMSHNELRITVDSELRDG